MEEFNPDALTGMSTEDIIKTFGNLGRQEQKEHISLFVSHLSTIKELSSIAWTARRIGASRTVTEAIEKLCIARISESTQPTDEFIECMESINSLNDGEMSEIVCNIVTHMLENIDAVDIARVSMLSPALIRLDPKAVRQYVSHAANQDFSGLIETFARARAGGALILAGELATALYAALNIELERATSEFNAGTAGAFTRLRGIILPWETLEIKDVIIREIDRTEENARVLFSHKSA